ncbi:hypothetical protein [Shewanella algae]
MIRHLGSSLNDIAYIFDEPSVGLHARDVRQLANLLTRLRNKGNSVLIVEHDPDVIAIADHVIDMGPGAGEAGGQVVYQGPFIGLKQADTMTGQGLRRKSSPRVSQRKNSGWLKLEHQSMFNVHDLSVDIPLGVVTVVAGVAGSGKSTLANRILPRLYADVVVIDQDELRASSRSTLPAISVSWTISVAISPGRVAKLSAYSGTMQPGLALHVKDEVLYAQILRFLNLLSLCVKPAKVRDTAAIRVAGKSIVQIMNMRPQEVLQVFKHQTKIVNALTRLIQVGLGYIQIGQRLSTLSGGERTGSRTGTKRRHLCL